MHALDHGVSMTLLESIVLKLQDIANNVGESDSNVFVKRLCSRLDALRTKEMSHITLISFVNAGISDCVRSYMEGQGRPIVDANDVQKLFLVLPFVLFSLEGSPGEDRRKYDKVRQGIDEIIKAVNMWLQWYFMYRLPSITEKQLQDFEALTETLMKTLTKVFPFVRPKGTSLWCTEKFHSLLHAARNRREVGDYRNILCQVTKSLRATRKYPWPGNIFFARSPSLNTGR